MTDTPFSRTDTLALYASALSAVRGDMSAATAQAGRLEHLSALMDSTFPGNGRLRLFSSPGRTEIGGNHTDHQGGCVLCAAVHLDIIALVRQVDEPFVRLASEGFDKADVIDLRSLGRVEREEGHSASLIRGIAAWYRDQGYRTGGFEAYTTSQVPRGSGLSSSAAFEILITEIFNSLYNDGAVPAIERALAAQYAENAYFGKPSGLMDQMACAVGGVTMIDFADPALPVIEPMDGENGLRGFLPVVTDTGGSHAGLTRDYASIPREMKLVAGEFGAEKLSAVDPAEFYRRLPLLSQGLPDRALLRAMHYFNETRRARDEAAAIRGGDTREFLRLVNDSGRSSWTLLQNVSTGRQDQDQKLALGLALAERLLEGQGAVRVHGGGFAGTLQAFVPVSLLERYKEGMDALFGDSSSTVLHIRPTGACEVQLP